MTSKSKPMEPMEQLDGQGMDLMSDRVPCLHGTIGEQKDEAYYDDRSDADDDIDKGRIKFPKDKLYGRDVELERLRSVYNGQHFKGGDDDPAPPRGTAVVFLGGRSGTGKSALIKDFLKRLGGECARPMFASGKYGEQQSASNPFSAIEEALRGLVSQVLEGDAETLQEIRWDLKEAGIGKGGEDDRTLIGTFPILSPLLCDSEEESPVASHSCHDLNLLKYAFLAFTKALCTEERRVVLFIDDLQWADKVSIELMTSLLTGGVLEHFLFIGAYRSNEVGEGHFLLDLMSNVEKVKGAYVHKMEIFNLTPSDIGEFIADSVNMNAKEVTAITECVYCRTMGNIFFVMQALEELVRKNALYYDVMFFQWQWNLSNELDLESFLSDDVIDMVKSKIHSLPPSLERLLVLASYTRNIFDAETILCLLEAIDGSSIGLDGVLNLLDKALIEGLVVTCEAPREYKFGHDRIQEAAHSLVSPGNDRDKLLAQVAAVLVDRGSSKEEDWMLFVAVNHFNSVPSHLSVPKDLAELNLRVAKLALEKVAFSQAVELLRAGIACLEKDDLMWKDYDLCLDMFNRLLSTEFALGNYENANAAINQVVDHARSLNDAFTANYTLIRCAMAKNEKDYAQASEKGIEILKLYGQDIPLNPSKKNLFRERFLLRVKLRHRSLRVLVKLPEAEDDSIFKLLHWIGAAAAFSGNSALSTATAFRAMRIACSTGVSSEILSLIVPLGITARRKEKYAKAFAYGNLAMQLLERFPNKGHEFDMFKLHSCVYQIRRSFVDSFECYLQCFKVLPFYGEVDIALSAGMLYCFCYFAVGFPLGSLLEPKIILFQGKAEELGRQGMVKTFQLCHQFLLNLRWDSGHGAFLLGPIFNEDQVLNGMDGTMKKMMLRDISIFRLQLAFIFGDSSTMEDMLERLYSYPMFDRPMVREHLRLSFVGFAALLLGNKDGNKDWLKLGRKVMKHFKKLVRAGSVNAYPVYTCQVALQTPKKESFDKAIIACSESNLMHLTALMHEHCGLFFRKQGDDIKMQTYLEDALWLYHDWGANAKVIQMKGKHPFLSTAARKVAPSKLSSLVRFSNKAGM